MRMGKIDFQLNILLENFSIIKNNSLYEGIFYGS